MAAHSVDELSDRLEVQDLLTRYAVAIDRGEFDLLDTVFLPDAHIDYTSSGGARGGYPEVKRWLAEVLPMFAVRQHLVTNTAVTFSADRSEATATSYFYNPMGYRTGDGSVEVFQVGGYYHDRLRRTADGWRIAERLEEQAWRVGALPASLQPATGG